MIQDVIENISTNDLKNLFNKHFTKKIFLVTGKSSYKNSGAQDFIKSSLKGIDFVRFSDFEQNPKFEDAIKGVELYKQSKCEVIVSIGGGSVMDMAKLINIFSANADVDSLQVVKNSKLISKKGSLHIAIPTTAGTGSEATHFAVVYHNKKKYSLAHEFVLPDIAGLNAKFTFTQPKYLAACAGLDALSQAIESYWSVGANDESKAYAKEAILLLMKNLEYCVNAPNDKNRNAVMHGAYLAGKAINISKTTAAHAVSYAFTTYFSVPHGHAVFLTLPSFFIFNGKITKINVNDKRGEKYVKNTMNDLCKLFGVSSTKEAKTLLDSLLESIGIETTLNELGVTENSDIQLIIDSVNVERMKNNPIKIGREDLETILTCLK